MTQAKVTNSSPPSAAKHHIRIHQMSLPTIFYKKVSLTASMHQP